jgi:hypothetical protein
MIEAGLCILAVLWFVMERDRPRKGAGFLRLDSAFPNHCSRMESTEKCSEKFFVDLC